MNKRQFLKNILAASGGVLFSGSADASDSSNMQVITAQSSTKVDLQKSSIVGLAYYDFDSLKDALSVGDKFSLVRESLNEHDRHAVAVFYQGQQLGYLSRHQNFTIATLLDAGKPIDATLVTKNHVDYGPWDAFLQLQLTMEV